MKILYLKTYYSPESVASSYLGDQTQEAFAREGYKMELFTPTPSRGLDKETIKKYRKIRVEEKLNGLLTIRRFPLYAEGKNPILRALRYFIFFCFSHYFICLLLFIFFNVYLIKTNIPITAYPIKT